MVGPYSGDFQDSPIFLTTENVRRKCSHVNYCNLQPDQYNVFHYIHSPANNRWAITLFYPYDPIFNFCDITDCEACDCKTQFCFKKLMGFISSITRYREAIDWGHVLDQWFSQRHASMEELVEKHSPANSSVPMALASIGPRRRR